jgi:hypothetical protein
MMTRSVCIVLLLLTGALAQQPGDEAFPAAVIYGVVTGQDGHPARGMRLTVQPLSFGFSGMIPHVRTNGAGEYRFENLRLGRYAVYADDKEAGYAIYITAHDGRVPEAELADEHREVELLVQLPPQAAFLTIKLTNQVTGGAIPAMRIKLTRADEHREMIFTMSGSSDQVVLIPPDRDLLLHVSSDGFREWQESVGAGRPIHIASGTRVQLDVQLAPLN